MNEIAATVRGSKELSNLLKELPRSSAKKAVRRATNAAATPPLKAARTNCPRDTGLLRKSLIKKIETYGDKVVAIIGSDRSVVETKVDEHGKIHIHRPANIVHLVENGHGGPHPAPAHPFLKPAAESTQGASVSIWQEKAAAVIEAEAERLGKL